MRLGPAFMEHLQCGTRANADAKGGNRTLAASAKMLCARIAKAAIQAVAHRSPRAALYAKVRCAQKVYFAKYRERPFSNTARQTMSYPPTFGH